MGTDTKIEWADHTANFWIGCTQISPACDGCYAKSYAERFGIVEWNGPPKKCEAGRKVVRAAQRIAVETGVKQFVFVNSLSDFFDKLADPEWRRDALRQMEEATGCIFLLLTKRIGNVEGMLAAAGVVKLSKNIRLGITVINQDEADRDILKLLAAKSVFGISSIFLSIEPMLGEIDLTRIRVRHDAFFDVLTGSTLLRGHGPLGITSPDVPRGGEVDWVIVGGESGANARPMHPDWVRILRNQCARAGVPFMFKQWGEWGPSPPHTVDYDTGLPVERVGRARAGRLLDGVEHNGRPAP